MNYGKNFSNIYSNHLIDFSVHVAPRIYRYLSKLEKDTEILDLCCGTGQLAYYFLTKDYKVTGVDLSEDMLYYARKLNEEFIERGQAEFYLDDARSFSLNKKYPVVVSTYDSLNHLQDEDSLIECFKRVYMHLEDGGVFIFDLNTERGLSRSGTFIREEENLFSIAQTMFDPARNKTFTRYYGFYKEDEAAPTYHKYDETIYNTIYKMKSVRQYLQDTGFSNVKFAHVNNLLHIIGEPEKEDRVFIIATKEDGNPSY